VKTVKVRTRAAARGYPPPKSRAVAVTHPNYQKCPPEIRVSHSFGRWIAR